jgi:hypothetical protein
MQANTYYGLDRFAFGHSTSVAYLPLQNSFHASCFTFVKNMSSLRALYNLYYVHQLQGNSATASGK